MYSHTPYNSVNEKFAHVARVTSMINQSIAGIDAINNSPINLAIKSYLRAETAAQFHRNAIMNNPTFVQMARYNSAQIAIKKGVSKFKKGFGNLKYLVDKDWYVSTKVLGNLELNRISELATLTNAKNIHKIEEFILDDFDNRKSIIFNYLKETVPQRIEVFEEIEKLFDLKLYRSLIIMCYSQADGISKDNWNIGFFDSENKKQGYELKIKKLNTRKKLFSRSIRGQLKRSKNEINRSSYDPIYNDKDIKLNSFNRHLVVHGHSLHYGTKKNSIRAILLLEFICDLVNEGFKQINQ